MCRHIFFYVLPMLAIITEWITRENHGECRELPRDRKGIYTFPIQAFWFCPSSIISPSLNLNV
jgi:hypothetical protein